MFKSIKLSFLQKKKKKKKETQVLLVRNTLSFEFLKCGWKTHRALYDGLGTRLSFGKDHPSVFVNKSVGYLFVET
jgi:hypothetical protein